MYETPMICPVCGELVIAWPEPGNVLIVPPHPDRVMPIEQCAASALVLKVNSRTHVE